MMRLAEIVRLVGRKRRFLSAATQSIRGGRYARAWAPGTGECTASGQRANPLLDYFEGHSSGRGIWKWRHYFEIYERHFRKFVGQEVHLVEVGVYSGGSLDMWKAYFGPRCRVYGVDIEPACKVYEDDRTRIFIGDQSDRSFWRSFQRDVPRVDIVIDDGGHLPEQQIATVEEMLPHLRPGGVYLCEDVAADRNEFAAYIAGFADALNAGGEQVGTPTALQRDIHSVHCYPFVVVIEKCALPRDELVAPKRGTEWQPFPFS